MNTSTVHLQGTVPVIPVTDIAEAMAFYRDRLGFSVVFQEAEYAGVTRDDVMLRGNRITLVHSA